MAGGASGQLAQARQQAAEREPVLMPDTTAHELLDAIRDVIARSDECPADDCGVNLIRDILVPAWTAFEIGEPKPDISGG